MREFEIHMPEAIAIKLGGRLVAAGQRDCGRGMVIVEFDGKQEALDALTLAKTHTENPTEVYAVRGI